MFVPSWEYVGPWSEIVTASMHTPILRHRDPEELRWVVGCCLRQWTPLGMFQTEVALAPGWVYKPFLRGMFSWDNIQLVKRHLRHLSVCSIDKCGQAVLIR